MTWLDLLIVYLACGAPFAVYRIALSDGGAAETAFASFRALSIWPYLAGEAAVSGIRATSRRLQVPTLRGTRADIERILLNQGAGERIFEFREIFDRYT